MTTQEEIKLLQEYMPFFVEKLPYLLTIKDGQLFSNGWGRFVNSTEFLYLCNLIANELKGKQIKKYIVEYCRETGCSGDIKQNEHWLETSGIVCFLLTEAPWHLRAKTLKLAFEIKP